MVDDFNECMVGNTRMAARAVTRRYDAYLKPHGLSATQFSLLGGLRDLPGATVSQVAEARGFDRTTLTRNLDRLEALGLVKSQQALHGNGRISQLTLKGESLIDDLLPLWRQAQADTIKQLGQGGFDESLSVLKRLATIQQGTENK
jgi:DNA-binding MarR family transcriptional regulator